MVIDGRSLNPQAVELSASATSTWYYNSNGTKYLNATLYGLWTTSVANCALAVLTDPIFALGPARSCIYMPVMSAGGLILKGGTYGIAPNLSGNAAISHVVANAPAVRCEIDNVTANLTADPSFSGTALYGFYTENVPNTRYRNINLTLDAHGSGAAQAFGIFHTATKTGPAYDSGGFLFDTGRIEIKIDGSAAGIWIGWDGTRDGDTANGKLNGGRITNYEVTGDADAAAGGYHGIAVASWADTEVDHTTIHGIGIGCVNKEASADFHDNRVEDCVVSYLLFKGSRPGAKYRNNRLRARAGYAGPMLTAHVNPGTGNNCAGSAYVNNHCVVDGASGAIFVDIDADQDVTLSGNNYFVRSGTLAAYPWRYKGVLYATLAAWKAAVEPDATSFDPG